VQSVACAHVLAVAVEHYAVVVAVVVGVGFVGVAYLHREKDLFDDANDDAAVYANRSRGADHQLLYLHLLDS
jgi:hypothetical protein